MLKVHTRNLGNVAVVCLQGRIVNGETASLREAVDSQASVSTVVLDLARVSTIDASGLGLMLALRKEVQARGIRFKITNASNLVSRVFEITRLDSVFELAPGIEFLPTMSHQRDTGSLQYARCA